MENTELKKTLLFGYSKNSVQDVVSDLKLTNQRLMDKLERQEAVIETLREKILRYESKDVLVSEVLVEAKHVAKKMIKEAHEEVATLRHNSEQEISERLSDFDDSIAKLESVKKDIINQELSLKLELKSIIQKYLAYVESIDLSTFINLKNESDVSLQEITKIRETMAEIEKDKSRTNKIVEFYLREKEVDLTTDEIPTYEFNELMS